MLYLRVLIYFFFLNKLHQYSSPRFLFYGTLVRNILVSELLK